MTTAATPVEHNEKATRFEMRVQGQLCIAKYHLIDGVMWITHTETPPQLQGRGHAARVVQAALDHARAQRLKVRPACSYVRSYMRRHSETHDLMETP